MMEYVHLIKPFQQIVSVNKPVCEDCKRHKIVEFHNALKKIICQLIYLLEKVQENIILYKK